MSAIVNYCRGPWLCLVGDSVLAMVPEPTGQERVERLWQAVAAGVGMDAPFAELSSGYLGELSSMPPFALVSYGAEIRAMIRGPLELQIQGPEGTIRVSGKAMSTWSEQVVPGARKFWLRAIEAEAMTADATTAAATTTGVIAGETAGSGPWYPIQAGIVFGAQLQVATDPATDAPAPDTAAIEPATSSVAEPAARSERVLSGLIESVPWARTRPASVSASPADPDATLGSTGGDPTAPVDDSTLVGRGREARPASEAREEPSGRDSGADGDHDGDHDGDTVMGVSLRAASEPPDGEPAGVRAPSPDAAQPPGTGPMVLARTCPANHANPPTNAQCSRCGAALDGHARSVRRPPLGQLRLSTGQEADLDRNIVLGRQPTVSRMPGNGMPRLIQVRSDSGDISRSHLEVRLEGWHVMVRDLDSTNGTVLHRQGQLPRRLGRGESTIVLDGDSADLGDGVVVTFVGLL